MKHDEKKIEKLWEKNTVLTNNTDTMFYEMFFTAAKQYAEHMVEQERERIVKEFENKIEVFANTEHIRWVKWQNYLHSFLKWNGTAWELPNEKKQRWQRQIETPYDYLTEKEKESDREQVRPYLEYAINLIKRKQ